MRHLEKADIIVAMFTELRKAMPKESLIMTVIKMITHYWYIAIQGVIIGMV